MSITDQERVTARHHLGYLNVTDAQTFLLGVPAAVQTQFMIEGSLNRILPAAEPRFRDILSHLEGIEMQVVGDQETLVVKSLGEITINPDEFKQLIIQYKFWQGALANLLCCQPNPFDMRPWLGASNNGINVSVTG